MKIKSLFIVACVVLGVSSCSKYKYETVKGDLAQTRIYTLENGLKVYLSVNKEEPRIQTYIAVRTGSKNDPAETTGLAHYLEHLMFKGTSQFGTNDPEAEKPLLDEIEKRYDLEDTRIYLHGDGAGWIRTGLEWLPGSRFVLDRYHYNKAIKSALAGVKGNARGQYASGIRRTLASGDVEGYDRVCARLRAEEPARSQKALESLEYLRKNIDGIAIYSSDPEASNGGCTEPHVSTVYSARLSSRPAGWSRETLSVMSRLLTGGSFRMGKAQRDHTPSVPDAITARAKATVYAALGAPEATRYDVMPALAGPSSQLVKMLRSISNLC